MTTDIYRRLMKLMPAQPLRSGTLETLYPDGTAQVQLDGGGGTLRAINTPKVSQGKRVWVRGDAVLGEAPALIFEEGEI